MLKLAPNDNRFEGLSKKQLDKELSFYKHWYTQTICRNTRAYIRSRIQELEQLIIQKEEK